jgi:D-sedoheptulose 7-phosphate isomerase
MSSSTLDPRVKNQLPPGKTVSSYLSEYGRQLLEGISKVDAEALDDVKNLLDTAAKEGKRIYVAGNGGSASISDHFCCDFLKGAHAEGHPPFRIHSLASTGPVLTAVANDYSYEECFSKQLERFGEPGDVVLLVSSSGNSPNIVKAIEVAKSKRMTVVGLCGFEGGKLNKMSDISLFVPVNNYGIVEDAHQMIMHALSQFIARSRDHK